ncbi:tRNA/tmRNA/rRNA uracil-C5-methylase, TrmA/RlmC/RlmD family [Candidatus Aquiluna sp. UB-MaderosW2red]|nr:tRNA/tmRNA/rRNA uracil-C5-methylase, TrmA/RlmC/RlmD family [Candidatus Aquiluna sp. UB-MaderosW2red]
MNVIIELKIEKVAHGGIFIARHEGKAVFVTGAIDGEVVKAEVYEDSGRYMRARVVEVVEGSEHRRVHFWKAARQGAGGAEFGHINLSYQRELKGKVLAEALERMAGIELPTEVMPVPGETDGLNYRTRVQLNVDASGLAGPVMSRTNDVIFAKDLPLAVEEIEQLGLHLKNWSGVKKISISSSSVGDLQWMVDSKVNGSEKLLERVAGRTFRLSTGGFWQVHKDAPELLVATVTQAAKDLGLDPSKKHLDLYAGAGLFSATLSVAFDSLQITAVESSKIGVLDGERSTKDLNNLKFVKSDVLRFLRTQTDVAYDTVVLDPPRSGAASKVIDALTAVGPKNIIYVACDPVALARDLKQLIAAGYRLRGLKAFDIFPHTHHFECVATLSRS